MDADTLPQTTPGTQSLRERALAALAEVRRAQEQREARALLEAQHYAHERLEAAASAIGITYHLYDVHYNRTGTNSMEAYVECEGLNFSTYHQHHGLNVSIRCPRCGNWRVLGSVETLAALGEMYERAEVPHNCPQSEDPGTDDGFEDIE